MKIPISTALLALTFAATQAQAGSGAIFTTIADGTIVNANTQYTSKCQVYLDGGPGANAPAGAAGLPAGDYYFQITDSSGKMLLSTDPVSNRRFTVSSAGVIVAYVGTGGPPHAIGIDQIHPETGAVTIAMANMDCPTDFLDTPNNGGVYKAWVTPVGNFSGDPTQVDNACGNGCYHGFYPSASKTDNFKVKHGVTFTLSITINIVAGDGTTSPATSWPVTVTDSAGNSTNYFTSATDGTLSVGELPPDTYTVSVSTAGNLYQDVTLTVNGVNAPPQTVYSFTWSNGQPPPVLVFGLQSLEG